MQNQRLTLDKLKSKLKTANVVANVQAVKGGILAGCHIEMQNTVCAPR